MLKREAFKRSTKCLVCNQSTIYVLDSSTENTQIVVYRCAKCNGSSIHYPNDDHLILDDDKPTIDD